MPAPRLKKIMFIIAYNIFIVKAILGAMELSIEFLLRNPKYIPSRLLLAFREYYFFYDRGSVQFTNGLARYDSSLYYSLMPGRSNFTNREFNVAFNVNEIGVRDDSASLVHPEIIVVGDSFAMGWGVDQDSTFAEVLEKRLKS